MALRPRPRAAAFEERQFIQTWRMLSDVVAAVEYGDAYVFVGRMFRAQQTVQVVVTCLLSVRARSNEILRYSLSPATHEDRVSRHGKDDQRRRAQGVRPGCRRPRIEARSTVSPLLRFRAPATDRA